jgi:hypothetical protein
MRVLLFPFIGIAALGLILSLLVHLSALFGQPIPLGHRAWGLHFGIFVVWIPTVIAGNFLARDVDRKNWWRFALRGCPDWYRYFTYGLFAYALINFAIFLMRTWAAPRNGGLSDEVGLIGFSGHWMAFYAAALGAMWSFATAGEEAFPRCPNGHAVDADSKFCKECGCPVQKDGDQDD